MNCDSIFQFLDKYALPKTKLKEKAKEPESEPSDSEINEISTQSQFESKCLSKPIGLCVFSFLILEPEYLENQEIDQRFKLSDMFPNLMVLNPNRKVYRPLMGSFDEEGIEKFLNDIAKGHGSSYEYSFDVNIDKKIKKKDDEKKVVKKVDEKKADEKIEKKDDEKKTDDNEV
ncbi:thioredoxin-domain-containing protein [Gigaspora margarita]|uniref:Thioredoxin-domain-containing protein n=1 Tax=Gigaspora margarita TaxID=4874 RepID=A0A8H4AZ41_GIGMA|nr:thioredoxin-domain-containing protein [Gigaspora margarita]